MGDVTLTNTPYDDVFRRRQWGGSVRPTVGVQFPWRQFGQTLWTELLSVATFSTQSLIPLSARNRAEQDPYLSFPMI